MTDQIPTQIGDYEILRDLGHGGMGQVYLVRNTLSDRVEAMKVLLPDLAHQGDLANRFMREIKVLASLEHPNIAALRTAFSANNQLVMIMEYVKGDTLAHLLERGPFATNDAQNYISQVLSALSYAHGKGIIHRDIKPSNMMLTPDGIVKLMDFGIARSSTDLGMTVTGTTLGSLDYMSPEQVKQEPTDARSDLYSVGVSLYEMVTGHRMFGATSSYSVMEAHVKEIPRSPIELQPNLPRAFNEIIMMAVAKDPAQRFQTADAFRNALSQVDCSTTAIPSDQATILSTGPSTQAVVATPSPQLPRKSPTPVPPPVTTNPNGSAVLQPRQSEGGGRHVGWLVVAAIVILVALFGGAEMYRSHRASDSSQATAAGSSVGAPAIAPAVPAAPPAATPAADIPSAQPQTPVVTLPPTATQPSRMAKRSSAAQQAQEVPTPGPPTDNQPSAEMIAERKKLLDDMETESDHLSSRAASVESSLDTLEQQMHQSGLGLRGDMVAARSNMRSDLVKAKDALDGQDTDRARKYMDQASREIEKLEAFLGHR